MSDCLQWYADNSELKGLNISNIPTVLLFGGIIVLKEHENTLKDKIEKIKAKYGDARAPVKWNFRDLKRVYEQQGQNQLYERMLGTSKLWREEIFNSIEACDFCVIVSVIESYSSDRDVIGKNKDKLSQYVFSNSLMRFGLHVQELRPKKAEVILDWPDKGISKPFDLEFASAYNKGSTCSKSATYKCGQLKKLGFSDHLLYSNMNHSTLLQLSDLVVGATREFIIYTLDQKGNSFGIECLKRIKHRFRGYPKYIYGRGINVSSGNPILVRKLKDSIKEFFRD